MSDGMGRLYYYRCDAKSSRVMLIILYLYIVYKHSALWRMLRFIFRCGPDKWLFLIHRSCKITHSCQSVLFLPWQIFILKILFDWSTCGPQRISTDHIPMEISALFFFPPAIWRQDDKWITKVPPCHTQLHMKRAQHCQCCVFVKLRA